LLGDLPSHVNPSCSNTSTVALNQGPALCLMAGGELGDRLDQATASGGDQG
jgi:hypothetical protein